MGSIRHSLTWYLLGVVGVLDIVSTYVGLSVGLVERNPIAQSLIAWAGMYGLLLLKLAVILCMLLLTREFVPKQYQNIPPIVVSVIWTVAVVSNTYLIASATGAL